MYLVLLTALPLELVGVASADPAFGRALEFVLPFTGAVAIFGLEFTIRVGRRPQTVESDAEGVRFSRAGTPAWTTSGSRTRDIRVRTRGRAAARWVGFRFRSTSSSRYVPIALPEFLSVARRVAGTIACYAPSVRIAGNVEWLDWYRRWVGDGDESVLAPGRGPAFFRCVGAAATSAGLLLSASGFLTGVVPRGGYGALLVAAYLLLGLAQVGWNEWAARREPARSVGR